MFLERIKIKYDIICARAWCVYVCMCVCVCVCKRKNKNMNNLLNDIYSICTYRINQKINLQHSYTIKMYNQNEMKIIITTKDIA